MSALHEWEESDDRVTRAREPAPGGGAAAVAAGIALGRLDRGWSAAPAPIRAAWQRGMLDREAAASAALEGWRVSGFELMSAAFDGEVAPAQDLRQAQRGRALLAAAVGRSPRQLFTPRRLAALARSHAALRPPGWDMTGRGEGAAAALAAALVPAEQARWRRLDPVCGMAALLACWDESGAGAAFGGTAGRALAARWPARCATTPLPVVPVSLGFRGRLGDYRPWCPGWPTAFATSLSAGLVAGLALLDGLLADRDGLEAWAEGRRKPASWRCAIDVLFEAGALSAPAAARRLGIGVRAAGDTLTALSGSAYVREISGRARWRVWAPRALCG